MKCDSHVIMSVFCYTVMMMMTMMKSVTHMKHTQKVTTNSFLFLDRDILRKSIQYLFIIIILLTCLGSTSRGAAVEFILQLLLEASKYSLNAASYLP